ncbi:MAG TPA: hypothetical protein VED01_23610 [Burkholderiales bacterium]|nr:hypothetical protein [Burkholderiales bacterium]
MTQKQIDKLQGSQKQESTQSANQGPGTTSQDGKSRDSGSAAGIGSSQAQDEARREDKDVRERPSAGTPDLERERGARSEESLVQDPVGAYKERP